MMDNARKELLGMLMPIARSTVINSGESYDVFGMIALQGAETGRALQRIQRKYKLPDNVVIALYRECMFQIMINIVGMSREGVSYAVNKNSTQERKVCHCCGG